MLGQARKWPGVLLEFTETLLPITEEECVQTNDADGQQDDHGIGIGRVGLHRNM